MTSLLQELRALEVELHHPGACCSRQRLEALLDPRFHEVGRSGRAYTRETVVDHLVARTVRPAVESSDFACDELARDCALLTYRSAHRTGEGLLVDPTHRSSIWLRSGGQWRLVYHQGTPAAEAA